MTPRLNIEPGDSYSRWVVVAAATARGNIPYFLCRCDCGSVKEVQGRNLQRGQSRSCGCLKRELQRTRLPNIAHGDAAGKKTTLYRLWVGIKTRCLNTRDHAYPRYGGRGITLHPAWEQDYVAFRDWIQANLGPRPEGCSLDRIDNDGNYTPGNLRWATAAVQANNRRDSVVKLTAKDVRDLRQLVVDVGELRRGDISFLAAGYGVHRNVISAVIHGKKYRDVASPAASLPVAA
jgi:hypothetical protein